jgi:hypothetical protein
LASAPNAARPAAAASAGACFPVRGCAFDFRGSFAKIVHPVLGWTLLFLGRLLIANGDDDLFRLLRRWRCGFLLGLLGFQLWCRLLFDDYLFDFSAH